jgi:hypothetical protein
LLGPNVRFDPLFFRSVRLVILFRTRPDVGKTAAALRLPVSCDQLSLQTFEVRTRRLLLREEFSGFNVVENRKRLSRSNPISNFGADFYNPSTRRWTNTSDPVVDGLNSPCSAKIFV